MRTRSAAATQELMKDGSGQPPPNAQRRLDRLSWQEHERPRRDPRSPEGNRSMDETMSAFMIRANMRGSRRTGSSWPGRLVALVTIILAVMLAVLLGRGSSAQRAELGCGVDTITLVAARDCQ